MKNKGFTLIELMVTVAILGITLGLAVPAFRDTIADNRLSTTTNDFISAIAYARSEAIKRNTPIVVITEAPSPATNEWGSGWKVQVTVSAGPPAVIETLREFAAVGGNTTVDSVEGRTAFVFNSRGLLMPGTGILNFNVCDDRAAEVGRQIVVGLTGSHQLNRRFNGC